MEDLGVRGFVDFVAASRPGTVDYHPVTRQVKRWVEARFRETVLAIPQKAQVAFLDVLRGVAYMYEFLLNDSRRAPRPWPATALPMRSSAEHAAWNKERAVGARDVQLVPPGDPRRAVPRAVPRCSHGAEEQGLFPERAPAQAPEAASEPHSPGAPHDRHRPLQVGERYPGPSTRATRS